MGKNGKEHVLETAVPHLRKSALICDQKTTHFEISKFQI